MKSPRGAPVMYLIAALCFLIAGVVGLIGELGIGAGMGMITLGIAFLILAYAASHSRAGSSHR